MCLQQSDEGQTLFGLSSTEIGGTEDSACGSVLGGKEGDGAVAAGEKGFTLFTVGRGTACFCADWGAPEVMGHVAVLKGGGGFA